MNANERVMKWPASVTFMRHDTSNYNVLAAKKKADPLYGRFMEAWNADRDSMQTRDLALEVKAKFALKMSDADTELADLEGRQAFETGEALAANGHPVPDIIYVSPYVRTKETLRHLTRGWTALEGVRVLRDERLREQEHGLANIYSDWRVFEAIHPEQRELRDLLGPYWYRYPNGENVPDVRERTRSWMSSAMRDFARKHVFVVTHHLTILSALCHLERLEADEFIRMDEHEKPINCGITIFRGYPEEGEQGKLRRVEYNTRHYAAAAA